jgi:hypothetical protein
LDARLRTLDSATSLTGARFVNSALAGTVEFLDATNPRPPPSVARAQTKLNEITTTMLSANMFNLVKALAGKDLGQALLRGPQTNWNGSSGSGGGMGASPGPDASPSASAEGAEEDGWRAAKLGSALAAVALGLAVGLAGMLSSSHGTPA